MGSPREHLIALNLVPATPAQWRRLVERLGSWEAVWAAGIPELRHAGLDPAAAQRLVAERSQAHPDAEIEQARRAGIELVTLADPGYPDALRSLVDPPPVLYIRGRLTDADRCAVALVGARHASPYGLACARRLAADLADCGITVVSGLARGIDAAAHEGAARAGGRTLAVLGSGLDRLYPPEHAELAAAVAAHGAILSEFPLGTPPLASNFPRRNRIISGLGRGVVVVEAGRRSGALITADCALEQGREVFAVPGPMTAMTSQGTHALLKQGARLVTGVADILEELGLAPPFDAAQGGVPSRSRPFDGAQGRSRAESKDGAPQAEPVVPLRPPVGRNPERAHGQRPWCESKDRGTPAAAARAGPGPARTGGDTLDPDEQRVIASISARQPLDIDAIAAAAKLASPEASAALLRLEMKRLVRQLPGKQFVRA